MAVSFIGRENRRTQRKPPTCRKSLTNFTVIHFVQYTFRCYASSSLNFPEKRIYHKWLCIVCMRALCTPLLLTFELYNSFEFLHIYFNTYRITKNLTVETDIKSFSVSLIVWAVILIIVFDETFTSQWSIFFSITVSSLRLTISLVEIKGKKSKLPIIMQSGKKKIHMMHLCAKYSCTKICFMHIIVSEWNFSMYVM